MEKWVRNSLYHFPVPFLFLAPLQCVQYSIIYSNPIVPVPFPVPCSVNEPLVWRQKQISKTIILLKVHSKNRNKTKKTKKCIEILNPEILITFLCFTLKEGNFYATLSEVTKQIFHFFSSQKWSAVYTVKMKIKF